MQKISRIYIGNCGVDLAWYDGVMLHLTDLITEEPTDALFNLENGGGKTILLSLIFSCLEPAQDRFLKHLQNPNHRFSQYFAKDGTPGLILIEWQMPPRGLLGEPYRLVIGQAAALKSTADRDDVDRIFFSFEESGDVSLDTVPGPRLVEEPVRSMVDFSRWMQHAQQQNPTFFHTRVQSDWCKHLRDECMLDLEMLQLQVMFSAQEGGIDEAFLDFKSEHEFIRKFFHLTLDAERTDAVRTAVIATCDKLRRKPFFQKRLDALTTLRMSLEQFNLRAAALREAEEAQQEIITQGGGLALSLEDRAHTQAEKAKDEANCRLTQQQVAEAAELRARGLADAEVVLSILRLKRLHGCAQEARNQANSQLTNLKEKQVHLRAARAQTEIDLTNQQLQALEERARLEAEQLVPWREKATEEGSKFWAALSLRADQFRQEAKEVKSAEQSAEAKRQALEQEARELRGREDTLKAERVRLDLEEESFQQEHQTLLNDGLVGEEEATLAAVERWSRQATTHQETAKQADTDAGILREDEARYRQTRRQEDEALRRLQTELSQKQSLVATGEAEREALGQLAILRQASESEVADPDAPGLPAAVQHIIESQRQDLDRLTIRLNELEERQKDIRETGVAGNSKDVAKVVSRLAEMGIRSAIPFNEYISKAIPDAEQARSVVTSNPARFMGVCIADSELAKARGIDAYLPELRAPVMVSTATLDPDPLPDNAFVLPASDDAWFNREAAQRLLAALEQTIDEERERRSQWLVRLGDAEFTAQRLASYLERYGNFRLATMRREAEQLALEADATKARSEEAEQKADACRELAENKKALAHQERSAAQDAERHAQTLRHFFEKHEANHPYRIERLRALELDLATVSNRQHLITEENEQLEIQLRNLRGRHNEIEALLRDTVREKEAIRHYDETSPVPDYGKLSDTELIFLRDNYRTAADTLDTNERERLGVLAYQLEQTRRDLGQKQEAFSRQFAELKREDFEAYLDEDFERCLANLEKEVEESGQTLLAKERALAVADSQLKQYTREHKPAYQPTEEMHELSDNALDTRIAEAQEGHRTATNEAEVAHGAAAEARQRQERAEAAAREAIEQAQMLRTALSLPEHLSDEWVQPEEAIGTQVRRIIDLHQKRGRDVAKTRDQARQAFDTLKTGAASPDFQEVEPEIASQLQRNEFDAACADSDRLLEGIDERIGVTQSNLDSMQADFEACVGELANLVNSAITLLNSATKDKKMPLGAPYVGGKAIIKMRSRFHELPQEARRQALHNYLDWLIETGQVPAKSAELVADALRRVHGRPLDIQMLRMVPDEALQYQPVDHITNSGGEGVVMAMLLYLLINQLRAETQAKLKRSGGGPLILDNPFAKATSPAMWRVQRMLAKALDVQLVFATAIQEYNTLGEFGRFNRLRKAGRNSKTGRWHLERVDYNLNPPTAP